MKMPLWSVIIVTLIASLLASTGNYSFNYLLVFNSIVAFPIGCIYSYERIRGGEII
jgi:hypothetical protein